MGCSGVHVHCLLLQVTWCDIDMQVSARTSMQDVFSIDMQVLVLARMSMQDMQVLARILMQGRWSMWVKAGVYLSG